jgi:hypothetical protein
VRSTCHIKINGVSWCVSSLASKAEKAGMDLDFKPRLKCAWQSRTQAQRAIEFIREQLPEASVELVEGSCDQQDDGAWQYEDN